MRQLAQHLVLATCLLAAPLAAPAIADEAADEQAILAQEAAMAARTAQMTLHQGLGLATLGGLAASAGLGLAVTNGLLPGDWRLVHVGVASLTSGLYLSTAGLALTAPHSPFAVEQTGLSSVFIHQNLAWFHAAGMAATVGLGLARFYGVGYPATEWHGALALSTLSLVGLSAGVIAFGQ